MITTTWLVCGFIAALGAGGAFLRLKRKKNQIPPASIVLLLRKARPLQVPELARLLSQVMERDVRACELEDADNERENQQPAGDMVTGRAPHFVAYLGGTVFLINSVPAPYMKHPARVNGSIPDLRLRQAVSAHESWLSMDILHPEAATPAAYRIVGGLLAKLIDSDCLAMFYPPANRFAAWSLDEAIARLKSDDPVKALFDELVKSPVIQVESDPRLKAAEAEARRRFDEFRAAFERQDGTDFSVKTLLSDDGRSEHIWVEVDAIVGDRIEGRLGNEPLDLGGLRLGSKVEVEVGKVEDWAFNRNGTPEGMFTVAVLLRMEQERSRK